MKFEICRTSDDLWFDKNKKPCKNAVIYEYKRIVTSPFRDNDGKLIRMEREITDRCWAIEINTLEDLLDLEKEVERTLIIDDYSNISGFDGSIEIYDGYWE